MTVGVLPLPLFQFLDDAGVPLAGARLFSYLAGTSTPSALYADHLGVTPLTNPAIADAGGKVLAYGTVGQAYKLNLLDAHDVQQGGWPLDYLVLSPAPTPGDAGALQTTMTTVAFVGTPGAATLVASGALPALRVVLLVQVTVTQAFGTAQGAETLACGDPFMVDRFGRGLTLSVGAKPLASGGMPFYPTATDLLLATENGLYDGTGLATAQIWSLGPSEVLP